MLYTENDFDQIKRKVNISRKSGHAIFFLHKLVIKCLSHAGVIKVPTEVLYEKDLEYL